MNRSGALAAAEEGAGTLFVVAAAACLLLLLVVVLVCFKLIRPWLQAVVSGAPISIFHVIGMRLRRNPPDLIISAYISMMHAGDEAPLHIVESVYIANRGTIRNAQDLIDRVREQESDNQ